MADMNTVLDKLRKAKYITKIDLKSAFMQVKVAKNSRKYTAFAVPGSGLWQFKRMPFGLVNSPKTFTRLIDMLFGPEWEPHVFKYLDDLIIISESYEEHLLWVERVLRKLTEAGLKINREKCEFACSSMTYLGYLLDKDGLRPDPERVKAVLDMPRPKNIKELRRALGCFGWYSRFIENEAEKKIPLVKLLRKETPWGWDTEKEEAFESLKKAITEAPKLARPDFSTTFTIHAHASNYSVGAVLTQEHEDGEHPIVYISKVLSPAERNYSTTDREMLAILFAIRKWRCYIEGYHFIVKSDHMALKFIRNVKEPVGRLARWMLELQQYDFEVQYKKGTLQVVADALSRNVDLAEEEIAAFREIKDEWYSRRINEVIQRPKKYKDWIVVDGLLYKHTKDDLLDPLYSKDEGWRLVVPVNYREQVLWDAHNEASSGHLGVEKTYDRVARDFYWPGVYVDVKAYVRQCDTCQRYKKAQTGPQGLMTGRHLEKPWVTVAADLMHFPRSSSQNKYLLVFQDLFTKWVELKPLRAATGKAISAALEELILFRWNTPTYLVSDNGKEFRNDCMDKILEEYNIKRAFIPPYYARANPVERANKTLKTVIAMYVEGNHRTWDKHLHEFRHALNTATQSSTKVSPAYLNFGRHPEPVKSLRREVEQRVNIVKITEDQWIQRMKELDGLRDLVYKNIGEATEKQKEKFNKGRKDVRYFIGNKVLLKTHILSDAVKGVNAKLEPVYEGPYTIKEVIAPYVYELDMGNSKRLTVAHSSELKRYIEPRVKKKG